MQMNILVQGLVLCLVQVSIVESNIAETAESEDIEEY